jgi:hypothetical protein
VSGRQTLVIAVTAAAIFGVLSDDWLAASALPLLALAWVLLRTPGAPPVLPLAFSFQWLQVTCALLYFDLTGRRVSEMDQCDYRPMVALALASLTTLLVGLALGLRLRPRTAAPTASSPPLPFSWLLWLYGLALLVSSAAQRVAWSIPSLTQALLALDLVHIAFLLLLLRRLLVPPIRWLWLLALLGGEVASGFTAYFAGFREALMMAALAVTEVFQPRRLAHWAALTLVALSVCGAGLLWTGTKAAYRRHLRDEQMASSSSARFDDIRSLSSAWIDQRPEKLVFDADRMVSRLWAIPYQALALRRVPAVIPHENGQILGRALLHIVTPRLFFPDKGEMPSDSDEVRRYSGVWVAGRQQGTSMAFGYVAESYVDFGPVGMMVPVLLFGLFMGAVHRWLSGAIRQRELSVAITSAICWVALFLYERSWLKQLGDTFTLLIVLGGGTLLVDRYLRRATISK